VGFELPAGYKQITAKTSGPILAGALETGAPGTPGGQNGRGDGQNFIPQSPRDTKVGKGIQDEGGFFAKGGGEGRWGERGVRGGGGKGAGEGGDFREGGGCCRKWGGPRTFGVFFLGLVCLWGWESERKTDLFRVFFWAGGCGGPTAGTFPGSIVTKTKKKNPELSRIREYAGGGAEEGGGGAGGGGGRVWGGPLAGGTGEHRCFKLGNQGRVGGAITGRLVFPGRAGFGKGPHR